MHNHGHVYRAKIVGSDGQAEYGAPFNTEEALRDSMHGIKQNILLWHKDGACTKAGCDVDQIPRVIAAL